MPYVGIVLSVGIALRPSSRWVMSEDVAASRGCSDGLVRARERFNERLESGRCRVL